MARLHEFDNPFVWESDGDGPRYVAELREPRPIEGSPGRLALVGEPRVEVCTRCGYAELSVLDAGRVPWHETVASNGVEVASRPCERCGASRVVHLSQVFPGHSALKLGRIDTTEWVRSTSEVGVVVGALCPDCGLLGLQLGAPRDTPWDSVMGFSRTVRPCPECGARLGRLEHAGDEAATVATAKTDHFWTEGVGHAMAWVCAGCGWVGLAIRDYDRVRWDRVRGFGSIPPGWSRGAHLAVARPKSRGPIFVVGCIGAIGVILLGIAVMAWWLGLVSFSPAGQ